MQDSGISSANALEIPPSCTKPPRWKQTFEEAKFIFSQQVQYMHKYFPDGWD